MNIPFETTAQKAVKKRLHLHPWLMTTGFLVYTLIIVAGHIAGFPLAYIHLQTVCPDGCGLTPENVYALERHGLSILFYANLYMAIQVLYILVSVGGSAPHCLQEAWRVGTTGSELFPRRLFRL